MASKEEFSDAMLVNLCALTNIFKLIDVSLLA
jgi:hypothetical protein